MTIGRFASRWPISSGVLWAVLLASCAPATRAPAPTPSAIPGAYRKVVSFGILEDDDKGQSLANVRSYEVYNAETVPPWWDGTAAEYAAVRLFEILP